MSPNRKESEHAATLCRSFGSLDSAVPPPPTGNTAAPVRQPHQSDRTDRALPRPRTISRWVGSQCP